MDNYNIFNSESQLLNASPWLSADADFVGRYFNDYSATSFSKGHTFYYQEENSDFVYLIRSGRVMLSIDNENGDAKGIFIADAGFIIGKLSVFDNLVNCCVACVVSDTAMVSAIPKSEFERMINTDISFCKEIMKMMTGTIRTLISQIRLLSFNSSDARVSYTLYHLIQQYSDEEDGCYKINITFTHQEIAELIGLSRVSVSNILSKMVKEGILEKRNGFYYVYDIESIYETVFDESKTN